MEKTQVTPSSVKRAHTDSANLFEHGNTPFRAGYSSNGSYQSPTRMKSGDKKLEKTAENPEEITFNQDHVMGSPLKFIPQSDKNPPTSDQNTPLEAPPSLSESLANFEKEWNSIIDKYSNVQDQGDVVDIVNGTIVTNNGHIELLDDEEDTIWDAMFPKEKRGDRGESRDSGSRDPAPSLLQQLGVSDEEEEVKDEKSRKKRRVSLWDV